MQHAISPHASFSALPSHGGLTVRAHLAGLIYAGILANPSMSPRTRPEEAVTKADELLVILNAGSTPRVEFKSQAGLDPEMLLRIADEIDGGHHTDAQKP